jgi:predicted SnoaL-like aldol condensation-catalyzing enzyme
VTDPDALFHSSDPQLNANKQLIYHIEKDLLQSGHAELADQYLTERYIQHNPNIPSSREELKKMLGMTGKPQPIPAKMQPDVVSVVAEGDFVTVAHLSERPDPKNPGKMYTTTRFDMWRIKDGKADEHWDGDMLGAPRPPPSAAPLN